MATPLGDTQVFRTLPEAIDSIPADELDGLLYAIVAGIDDDYPFGGSGRSYARHLARQWMRYLGGEDKRSIAFGLLDHFEGFLEVGRIKDALLKSCAYK